MIALNETNVDTYDLTKLNDNGVKELYKLHRKWYNQSISPLSDWNHSEDDEKEINRKMEIVKRELDKRGHIPNKVERKQIRQEKAKRKH